MTTFQLVRGPLLMTLVIISLTIPLVLQLSAEKLICLGLFAVGLVITLCDVAVFAETRLRQSTLRFLENLVMDDVLRSIFDPETGWIACWVSMFVGNASMYALPMTSEQRVRLVQSCLWTSEEQARTILTSPGGFKVILPESLQSWLNKDPSAISPTLNESKCDVDNSEHECDSSNQSEETEPDERETKEHDAMNAESPRDVNHFSSQFRSKSDAHVNLKPRTETRTGTPDSDRQTPIHESPHVSHPPYPMDAMGSILRELASDVINRTCTGMPDSAIQTVGVVASAVLALHLSCSPRARKIVAGAVEGTAALTLASVAAGAMAALVTKALVVRTQQRDGASGALRHDMSPLGCRILAKLRDACTSGGGGIRRLQGMIALLVLLYVGRRRTGRLHRFEHARR